MIRLRRMTEEEFLKYKKDNVADYARDLLKGKNITEEQALMKAENEFNWALPDGLDTPDNFLMKIIDAASGKEVGIIWFLYEWNQSHDTRNVFLSDLLIYEPERRKGYASAAVNEMNSLAKADGCRSSVLFVWEHNPGGARLYEKCGYEPAHRIQGGTYMKKAL